MKTPLKSYTASGYSAGLASKQKKIALYEFQRSWYELAMSLETIADRPEAKKAWLDGFMSIYKENK